MPKCFRAVDNCRDKRSSNHCCGHRIASEVLTVSLCLTRKVKLIDGHALEDQGLTPVESVLTVTGKVTATRGDTRHYSHARLETIDVLADVPNLHLVHRVMAFLRGLEMGDINGIIDAGGLGVVPLAVGKVRWPGSC